MAVSYIELVKRSKPDSPPFRWHETTEIQFQELNKPLHEVKLALLSSSGVFHKNQMGFNPEKNDYTYRIIEKTVNQEDLKIHHDNYDHSGAEKDITCVYPYKRLQELENEGVIKEFSQRTITFMGRLFSKTKLFNELIPNIIEELRHDKIDAALLVPV